MSYQHHRQQSGLDNLGMNRKTALRLCSSSPRISAFERQLSLMKTPAIMQHMNINSPSSGLRPTRFQHEYTVDDSPTEFSSNSSDATLVADIQIEQTNSLKRNLANSMKERSPIVTDTSTDSANTHNFQSINFQIPVKAIVNIVYRAETIISDITSLVGSTTKEDVDCFLDYLSEVVIGVFVIFGAEILKENKDAFSALVSLVILGIMRIAFANGDYDSLLLQGQVIPIFESSNLPNGIKKSVTHFIVTLQFYVLFSTLRVTAIFKSQYALEDSRLDNLSIMELGLVMVLLCLNLIINALPSFRRYSSTD